MMGIDIITLLKAVGYAGVFGIVFAESGVLVGFFLPGDSLLFTAGLLGAQGFFNIWVLLVVVLPAAILGDNAGYAFGRKVGPLIFRREDSLLFHRDHLERARRFYERYGGKALVLARFLPVVRTFVPILAGVGKMHYTAFVRYNFLGGVLWGGGVTLAGFFLGRAIPDIDRYLLPIVVVIIVASFLPQAIYLSRGKRYQRVARSVTKRTSLLSQRGRTDT